MYSYMVFFYERKLINKDDKTARAEMLLNYLTKLARALMSNGATVEHAEIAVRKNAEVYHVQGLSCLIMNDYV